MCLHLPHNCWHQKQLFSHFLFWSYALLLYWKNIYSYKYGGVESLQRCFKIPNTLFTTLKMVRCQVFYVWCFVLFGALSTLVKSVWQSTQYQTLQVLWKTSDKCVQIWLMYSTVSTFCEQNSLLYCCVFFKVEYPLLCTAHALSS